MRRLATIFLTVAVLVPAAAAQDDDAEKGWKFQLAPMYVWATSITGSQTVLNQDVPLDASFGEIRDALDFVGTIHFEGNSRRWGFLVDGTFMRLKPENEIFQMGPTVTARADFDQDLIELSGYHRFAEKYGSFDLILGARHFNVKSSTFLNDVQLGPGVDQSWTDVIVGGRVNARLSDKVTFLLRGDIGTGGSNFEWNVVGLIHWRFAKHWALGGGFRVLDVDYEDGEGPSRFALDANYGGPLIGIVIHF